MNYSCKSLTNVRACEQEPFFASLEPLLANHCFFFNIFPFSLLYLLWQSWAPLWKWWKSEKILNKQTRAWKVLCTLFTHWCAHLQSGRIYRCRCIRVGSSNFFQHLRIFGTLDRWFVWRNGLLEISILRPSHRTAPGKLEIQPFSDLFLSISNQHLSQNRRNSHSARCAVRGKRS